MVVARMGDTIRVLAQYKEAGRHCTCVVCANNFAAADGRLHGSLEAATLASCFVVYLHLLPAAKIVSRLLENALAVDRDTPDSFAQASGTRWM